MHMRLQGHEIPKIAHPCVSKQAPAVNESRPGMHLHGELLHTLVEL